VVTLNLVQKSPRYFSYAPKVSTAIAHVVSESCVLSHVIDTAHVLIVMRSRVGVIETLCRELIKRRCEVALYSLGPNPSSGREEESVLSFRLNN
jgi:hypothetical protein